MVFTRPRVGTRSEPKRQPKGPARAPARTPSGPLIASPAGLLHIQQAAGNAAATAFIQRQPEGAVVQRSGQRTLRFGHTGPDVKVLQMKLGNLRERAHDVDEEGRKRIDGIFGPLTQQDVIDFQTDTGLDPDGVVGPKTWDALNSLVPGMVSEEQEVELDERFGAAYELEQSGRYDDARELFEQILAEQQPTPETAAPVLANIAVCHHQRGRFGIAVTTYERALAGRFNTEGLRAQVLDDLGKARRNEFRAEPRPDPEPLPPGADAAAAAGREGGGVTERQPAKSGDSGPAVDLFKGKLAHMMVGWPPPMLAGDVFDAPTSERTRAFQQACGLEQTGEADAPTWHALDSFTKADVPFSVVGPLLARAKVVHRASLEDPAAAASLPMWEAISGEAKALGLVEIEKHLEVDIGHAHHALSHFPEAAMHYENYLTRTIPNPPDYGMALELLRRAHRGEPTH